MYTDIDMKPKSPAYFPVEETYKDRSWILPVDLPKTVLNCDILRIKV